MQKRGLYQNPVSTIAALLSGGFIALASSAQLPNAPFLHAVVYVVIAAVALYFVTFRLGRGGLLVSAEGVRVRNPLRTTGVINWSDIEECIVDTWHGLPDVAFLELRDEVRVPIVMLEIPPFERGARTVRSLIRDFNERVEAQRSV